MIIRPISDIHLEFGAFELPVMENEANQVLCILGDLNPSKCLWELNKGKKSTEYFFKSLQGRFKDVLYITGNHEYYDGDVNTDDELFEEICDQFGYTFLQNGVHKDIEDTRFIGATLWADFEKEDPNSMFRCRNIMSDFTYISDSAYTPDMDMFYYPGVKARFTPDRALSRHYMHKYSIFKKLSETVEGMKTVIMTHHAPSYQSVAEKYKFVDSNGAYYSDLEKEIIETFPNLC